MVETAMSAQQIPFCFRSGVRFLTTPATAFFVSFLSFFFMKDSAHSRDGKSGRDCRAEQTWGQARCAREPVVGLVCVCCVKRCAFFCNPTALQKSDCPVLCLASGRRAGPNVQRLRTVGLTFAHGCGSSVCSGLHNGMVW